MNALQKLLNPGKPKLTKVTSPYIEQAGQPQPPTQTKLTTSTLNSSPMRANESADLYGLQSGFQSELSDRIFQEERIGDRPHELAALKNLFMRKRQEMQTGPIEEQQAQTAARNAAMQEAMAAGFGGVNPTGEMAAYNRGQQERELEMPLLQEREVTQRTAAHDASVGRNQLDVMRQTGENQANQQRLINEQSDRYLNRMYPEGGGAPDGARPSFNAKTGAIGGTPAPRQIATSSLLNPLAVNRANLAGLDPWDDKNVSNRYVQEFRQRWAGILNTIPTRAVDPVDGSTPKDDVQRILRDPNLRNMSVEDLYDVTSTDKQYLSEVRQLLDIAKGMVR